MVRTLKMFGWVGLVVFTSIGYRLSESLIISSSSYYILSTGVLRVWMWLMALLAPMFTFVLFVAVGVVIYETMREWAKEIEAREIIALSRRVDPLDPNQR